MTVLTVDALETTHAVARSILRGHQFLLDSQSRDGAWRDFQLKPGRAESWTTAYVASCLLATGKHGIDPKTNERLDRAASFLSLARQRGGWSYNQQCGPDADTTAQVILFLRGFGKPLAMTDYANLAKFQVADGHFATFRNCGGRAGWESGHAEVTATAMRALGSLIGSDHSILHRAELALRAHLEGAHGTESYWWLSRNYLSHELILLARAYPGAPQLPVKTNSSLRQSGAFDRALGLEVSCLRKGEAPELTTALSELLDMQLADGSWPAQPILRVTDPRVLDFDDPLFEKSIVAADDRRTFTTATVLRALSNI